MSLFIRLQNSASRLLLLLSLSAFSVQGIAQTPIPAVDPDVMFGVSNNLNPLSSAMIECGNAGTTLSAITYHTSYGSEIFFTLGDGSDSKYLFADFGYSIPANVNSTIDIAIADDLSNPGQQYNVAIIYLSGSDVNLEMFTLDVSSGSINLIGILNLPSLASGLFAPNLGEVRIDAVANVDLGTITNSVGENMPLMDMFLVMYPDATGDTYVGKYMSDLSWVNTFNVSSLPFFGTDIAASTDLNTGKIMACIAGIDGGDAYCKEYDVTTGGSPGPSFGPLVGNTFTARGPRIEAFGYYNPTFSIPMAKWCMNTYFANPLTGPDIRVFTDLSSVGYSPMSWTGNNEYHTVAAGIGPTQTAFGGYTGNKQYNYGWGSSLLGHFCSNAIVFNGSPMNPFNYYEIDQSSYVGIVDPKDLLTMSSSCNTGRGMVSAWNDGNNFMYKVRDDGIYQFRPNNNGTKAIYVLSLSPNPANNSITIQNPNIIEQISISNALGSEVLVNRPNATQTQKDISKLPSGNYFVTIKDKKGNLKPQKLVVQI